VEVWHGQQNAGGARACIPNRKMKCFYHSALGCRGRRVKHAGCGQVRSQIFCLGHVLIALRQNRQRHGAVTAEKGQLGRSTAGLSKYNRLYQNSDKLALAAMYFRRVRVHGRSFAAGAPLLTHL
jgi:hypothetical protein